MVKHFNSSLIAMWRRKNVWNSYIIWSNKIENVLKILPDLYHRTYLNVKIGVEYWAFETRGQFRFTSSLSHHHTRFWKSLLNIPSFLHIQNHFFRWQHDTKKHVGLSVNRFICPLWTCKNTLLNYQQIRHSNINLNFLKRYSRYTCDSIEPVILFKKKGIKNYAWWSA